MPGHHLRRRRARAAEHPLHRQRGQRHPGAYRRTAVVRIRRVPRRRQGRFDRPRHPAGTAAHRPGADREGRRNLGRVHARAATDLGAVDARAAAVKPDDVSDILFTSGTTGRSKGALCAHRQSLAGSAAWAECGQITSDDRYLCINPFFHNFGYKAGILACLQTGATLIPQLTFDPEQAMRAVRRPPHHRAARAADDLSDAARPPQARRLRPVLAAVRGHRRGGGPRRADRTHADRTRHRHRADRLRPDRGQRLRHHVPGRRRRGHRRHHLWPPDRGLRTAHRRARGRRRGRGAAARAERHAGLPRRPGGHRRRDRLPTAGCTPATSAASTTPAT